jgi:hypothetical protein
MPVSPVYRSREIARPTCIRAFTGRHAIKSGVFDATTLTLTTITPPSQYVNIWGAQGVQVYNLPIGTLLTQSTTDPTKVKAFQALGANANDVQTITITGSPTGGTFTLTWNGQTTAPIAYNASAATVAAALALLPNIGPLNVSATGGALPGSAVVVTFQGLLANEPQAVMTASGAGLTGGSSPAVAITHTTPGTAAEKIIGVYDGPDKDFFGDGSVVFDEVIPIYFMGAWFDVSKIQNWNLYGTAAMAALTTCTFS